MPKALHGPLAVSTKNHVPATQRGFQGKALHDLWNFPTREAASETLHHIVDYFTTSTSICGGG